MATDALCPSLSPGAIKRSLNDEIFKRMETAYDTLKEIRDASDKTSPYCFRDICNVDESDQNLQCKTCMICEKALKN